MRKKKNGTWRAAALLLVLTLITSCFVGGTFAKYTTSDDASDTARVAKWGVTVEVSGNLFGTDYNKNSETEGSDSIAVSTSDAINVAAGTNDDSTRDNVVAPGTKNDTGLTIKIAGKPEVAYTVTASNGKKEDGRDLTVEDIFLGAGDWGVMIEETGLNAASTITEYYTESSGTYTKATGSYDSSKKYYKLIDKATVAEGGYYPIKWTYNTTGSGDGTTTTKLATASKALINAIKAETAKDAGTDAAKTCTLKWEWPFDTESKDGANDPADTILGNLMAGNMSNGKVVKKAAGAETYSAPAETDYNLEIVFGMKVTVEQAD